MSTRELLSMWAIWSLRLDENPPFITIDEDLDILGRSLNWSKPEDGIEFVFEKTCGRCSNCNGVTCGGYTGDKITKAIQLEMNRYADELDARCERLGVTVPDPETHTLQKWMMSKTVPTAGK